MKETKYYKFAQYIYAVKPNGEWSAYYGKSYHRECGPEDSLWNDRDSEISTEMTAEEFFLEML